MIDDIECPDCNGTGWVRVMTPRGAPPEEERCDMCGGTGVVRMQFSDDPGPPDEE